MKMIDKIKEIEKYVCSNFEELDLDDPVEEGYFEKYENISGMILHFLRKNLILYCLMISRNSINTKMGADSFLCCRLSLIKEK